MIWALMSLAVALAASVWTTAHAFTEALPNLMWLQRMRREPSWAALALADRMADQLDVVILADNRELFGVPA